MLVHHFLETSAARLPKKIALICGDQRLTYHEISRSSDQLAAALLKMKVKKQDRVAIFLDNSAEAVISIFGVLKAGGIFIPLNPSIKTNKFGFIMKDSGARVLIAHPRYYPVIKDAIENVSELRQIISCDGDQNLCEENLPTNIEIIKWDSIFSRNSVLEPGEQPNTIDIDLAAIIYTSGSTGNPKGVMPAHYNIISAVRSITHYLTNVEDDIILSVLPLSFDYGLYQVFMTFFMGSTLILERSFSYPYQVIECISREHVTGFPIVPTISAILLQMKDPFRFNYSSLKYITNTGAVLPKKHILQLQRIFPKTKIYSMYGLTECKRVSFLPPVDINKKPESVGIPMPNVDVFIVDDKGVEVKQGEIGELVVRGSNVMQGYWNDPEATANAFRAGRYRGETHLFTGDFFRQDSEGYLYFVARKDDLIKVKGERVSPKEIENVLCEIVGVSEAAAIGVPDDIFGQAVKAFIVPEKNINLSEKAIKKHCIQNLEPHIVPKFIEFISSLPKTENGKIDKKQLK